ncbi:MAG: hypothetical protein NVSMB46_03930 [Candidatus Saccharimonadales bacterium]
MKLRIFSGQPKKNNRLWPIVLRSVHGHSMIPVLPPRTLVYGLQWFRKIKPGQVVIFNFDGRENIKRIEKVENGKIFVMGDHVKASLDSRQYGWLPKNVVVAKVVWPHAPKQKIF